MKKNILKEEVTEMKNLINKLLNRDEPEKKAPLSQEDRRNMRDNEDRYHLSKGLVNKFNRYLNNPKVVNDKENLKNMLKMHLDISWDSLSDEEYRKNLEKILKNKEEGQKVIEDYVNNNNTVSDLKNNLEEFTKELSYYFRPLFNQESKYY